MKKRLVVLGVVGMMLLGSLSVSWADDDRPGKNATDSAILLAQARPPKIKQKIVPKPGQPARPGTIPATPVGSQPANVVPASMNIIKPDAGTRWCIGTQQTIQWSGNLVAATSLKIELLNSVGSLFKVVAASAPNTGSYLWDIQPAQYNFGEGFFKLRISTLDGKVKTETAVTFRLGKPLVLQAPKSNYTWRKGSAYTISWSNGCGIAAATVKVELLNNSKALVQTIVTGHPLKQTYRWTVPTDLAAGVYYIRVTTTDNLFSDEESFTIGEPL